MVATTTQLRRISTDSHGGAHLLRVCDGDGEAHVPEAARSDYRRRQRRLWPRASCFTTSLPIRPASPTTSMLLRAGSGPLESLSLHQEHAWAVPASVHGASGYGAFHTWVTAGSLSARRRGIITDTATFELLSAGRDLCPGRGLVWHCWRSTIVGPSLPKKRHRPPPLPTSIPRSRTKSRLGLRRT